MHPVVRAVAHDLRREAPRAEIAARFHVTMAEIVVDACCRASARTRRASRGRETRTVALSGACFENRLLTELSALRLTGAGFDALVHRFAPPNDGGLALGQAAIVAYRLRDPRPPCA